MARKPTSKATKRKRLTPTEYLLFNDLISRIRALEHVATQQFMKGDSDRSKMARDLGKKIDRLQTSIPAYSGRCPPGYCKSDGICHQCDAEDHLQQLLAGLINA